MRINELFKNPKFHSLYQECLLKGRQCTYNAVGVSESHPDVHAYQFAMFCVRQALKPKKLRIDCVCYEVLAEAEGRV